MASNRFNPSLLEESVGALTIGANLIASPLTRGWYAGWGATPADIHRSLPGDAIVPNPRLVTNRAITIRATPAEIWPWLVQLGQGRGGLYTFQHLENIVRCQMENVDEIRPELQSLAVGDQIRLGPEGYPFYTVLAMNPDRTLVLRTGQGDDTDTVGTWVFHLEAVDKSTTRLLVRSRLVYPATVANRLIWRGITDPIYFVMERRMLIGIRDRAEFSAATAPRLQAAA